MTIFFTAFIGLVGLVLTHFVSVDFKRFRDGTSLAAALTGELSAHASAIPALRSGIERRMAALGDGRRIVYREVAPVGDPVFENAVPHLGLLNHELVEDIVYAYQQIRAFRSFNELLQKQGADMSPEEQRAYLAASLAAIERADTRGTALITRLRERACANYSFPFLEVLTRPFKRMSSPTAK
jgi:hypothetical protein